MRTCLRKLVNVAESKESELSFALQDIERHLVFCGFGSELDIKKAIELMEEVGYIAKDDFIL